MPIDSVNLVDEDSAFIDRFAIAVRPTWKFLEWVNGIDDDSAYDESAVLIQSIYLVQEMDTFDLETITTLMSHYYQGIASNEFAAWSLDMNDWPLIRNLDEFFQYFECVPSDTVIDLVALDDSDSYDESEELDWSDED